VDEVAGSRPYAVYGHSLGALVAFELIREIGRRGAEQPVHLFVSGCAAPHCPPPDEPVVTRMARVEVVRMLRRLGGTPDWLLEDPNLLDLILPAVRSDFAIKESYGYVSGPPLAVPVTVVSSTDDKAAPHDLQARWAEQTSAQFRLYTLTGGHFAVFEQAGLTHAYLADALRAWL
jgi:surfactin synthase thioesterase subunit